MTRFRLGLTGTVAVAIAMVAAMQIGRLPLAGGGGRSLDAYFTEAGGLRAGSPVLVSGAKVGKVESISIDGDRVRVRFSVASGQVRLGRTTQAAISTLTLLGKAGLELKPGGTGTLREIPLSRTSSPYDITDALAELTTRSASIDVGRLSQALSTASVTLATTPTELDRALRGVTAVARSVSENGDTLDTLLTRTRSLTGVLQSRNARVATLLTSGADLVSELNAREQSVVVLLSATTRLTDQLNRLVKENRSELKPALTMLNRVTALLNQNRANLQKALVGAEDYAVGFGDTLSSGPFFDAYVQNLTAPVTMAPFLSERLR